MEPIHLFHLLWELVHVHLFSFLTVSLHSSLTLDGPDLSCTVEYVKPDLSPSSCTQDRTALIPKKNSICLLDGQEVNSILRYMQTMWVLRKLIVESKDK